MIDLIQGDYITAKTFYTENTCKEYFEFHFPYVSTDMSFRELDRFLWESKHEMTRFKNRYVGPVLIDLTEWNRHKPNEYFDAFMYYMLDNPELKKTFIVQDQCGPELLDRLNSLFQINRIMLETKQKNETRRKIGFYIEEEATPRV